MFTLRPRIAAAIIAIAGLGLLGWAAGARHAGQWMMVFLLAVAAAAIVLLRPAGGKVDALAPAVLLAAAGVAAGAAALWFLAPFNAVLLYGAFLLFSGYVCGLFAATGSRGSRRPLWIVNMLVTAALLFALPRVNGATILFSYVKFPTSVGLFPDPPRGASLDEWSRARLRSSKGTVVEVPLRSTRIHRDSTGLTIRLTPYRPTEFLVHYIELVSYVGYDGKALQKFYGPGLSLVEVSSSGEAVDFSVHEDYIEIPPAPGPDVFIDVPLPDDPHALGELPARRRNAVSAIVHWQFGFLLFMWLAPWRQGDDRD